jgi:hypothetical protein
MELIKVFVFTCFALSMLTGSRCSISSNFDDDDDDDKKDEGIIIVVSNAEVISNEVVDTLRQTLIVAEIASQSMEYLDDINTHEPIVYPCDNTNGVILVTTSDLYNSNTISIRDDLLLNYSNCSVDNVVMNGGLTISLLDAKGFDIGKFDSGTDWLYIIGAETNSLQVSKGNETFIVDGEMTVTVKFDATIVKLDNNITSGSLSLDNGSKNILSDIDISQLINLATVPSSYALVIESLRISSSAHNGTVDAATTAGALSGIELLNMNEYFIDLHSPENGMLSISGKNSNASLSIMPDQSVSIDIDSNGDSISDAVVSSTWSQLQSQ